MDNLIRVIARDGSVMCCAVDSTKIAGEAERIHKTSATVTAALGRLLTAGAMMGSMLKNPEDSVTLRLSGGGPAGKFTVVADGAGMVKGDVENPIVEIPLNNYGKLDVAGAVGKDGSLTVIRDLGFAQPTIGSVPIVSGEIAEDVTYYYAVSEQTPTVCALGVLVNPDLTVQAAGGLLIQLLPFCPEAVIDQVEKNVAALEPMTVMLSKGMTTADICAKSLEGMPFDILDTYEPAYRCTCSRQKVERALLSMKPEELLQLPDDEGKVEATCQFCDAVYRFSAKDLEVLAAESARTTK